MGLNSSKAHPKVTKVAPVCTGEDLPVLTTPYWHPSMPGQPNLHPPAAAKWGNTTIHKELPPLRETWYRRASAGKEITTILLQTGFKLHPYPNTS
uniref:Uncharacterized protein n=1 Tax=Melopsittacus undulatus TaxID=13146 RepID=A0A8C6IY84_MELUD